MYIIKAVTCTCALRNSFRIGVRTQQKNWNDRTSIHIQRLSKVRKWWHSRGHVQRLPRRKEKTQAASKCRKTKSDFSKAARQKKMFFFFHISFSLKGWNFVLRPLNDPKGRKTLSRIAAIAGWRESCFSTDILQYLITSWRFCWMKGRTYLQRWKMHPLKEGYRKNSEHGLKNAIESLIRRWDYERISGKHAVTPLVGGGYFL